MIKQWRSGIVPDTLMLGNLAAAMMFCIWTSIWARKWVPLHFLGNVLLVHFFFLSVAFQVSYLEPLTLAGQLALHNSSWFRKPCRMWHNQSSKGSYRFIAYSEAWSSKGLYHFIAYSEACAMDCHSCKACPISGMVAGGFLSVSVLNIWLASLCLITDCILRRFMVPSIGAHNSIEAF